MARNAFGTPLFSTFFLDFLNFYFFSKSHRGVKYRPKLTYTDRWRIDDHAHRTHIFSILAIFSPSESIREDEVKIFPSPRPPEKRSKTKGSKKSELRTYIIITYNLKKKKKQKIGVRTAI